MTSYHPLRRIASRRKSGAKWLSRALVAFGLVSFFWWSYGLLAPEPADIPPQRLSVGHAAGTMDAGTALAGNLDAPLLEGNRVDLLINGDEIFPSMLAAIRNARKSIHLLSYIYWEGDIAKTFADELSAAAGRGVETRLLVDAFGGRRMDPALIEGMRAAGVEFAWFHPVRWYSLRRVNNRTHRKVMVVDGRVGYTGGVGIGSEWTGDAQDPEHWRDDHFRVEGPVVRYLQGAFAENWRQASGEVLAGEGLFPILEEAGNARIVPLNAAPLGTTSDIAFTYWLLFKSARNEICITTPYFVPDPDMDLGIEEAARRGVKVTLLVPGEHQDSKLAGYASHTYYRDLLLAGVRIFEYVPTMMHVKSLTVDDEWAVIGSANFDSRSFELNYEIALAVQDRSLIDALNASHESDLLQSRELTLADVEARSLVERGRNWIARQLREQL